MRCETTSVIFDWTFDGPVNRITQNKDTIVLQYGQLGFTRTMHMNQATHPANIKPSRAGHSIGRWENDVLIVDTVGFAPGVLSPPVLQQRASSMSSSGSRSIPKAMTLTRSYVAEDPVYFKGQYAGSDVIQVADLPYNPDQCKELGFRRLFEGEPRARIEGRTEKALTSVFSFLDSTHRSQWPLAPCSSLN